MKKTILVLVVTVLCACLSFLGYQAHHRNTLNPVRLIEEVKNLANPPYLTVVGIVKMGDGIGRLTVELLQTLKGQVKANFIHSRNSDMLDLTDVPKEIVKIIKSNQSEFGQVVIFEDILWDGNISTLKFFKEPPGKQQIRIAYSMFESTQLPPEWGVILNTHFDAVVVPDKCLIEVYKNSGVQIPVFEVPLGLDLSLYLEQPLKTKRHHPMVFANFSSLQDRKNHISLVRGFAKAFGNNPNVHLRINSRFADPVTKTALKKEIQDLNLSNVFYTEFWLEGPAYLKLFQTVDCYVNIARGEGFSIQPREAMAMGIPVIVTDNTAQTTICNSQLVKAVPSSILTQALYFWGEYYGYNFDCEVDDVADALKEVYENYDQYLQNAEKARKWVQNCSYDNLRPLYLSLIMPKQVLLGDVNKITPDYLMTTSEELYQKYQDLIKRNQTKVGKMVLSPSLQSSRS